MRSGSSSEPRQLLLGRPEPGLERARPLVVLGADGLVLLPAQLGDAVLQIVVPVGGADGAQPDPGTCLVHQVDGLVREEAVAEVAVGEGGRRVERLVGEAHLVVDLVGVAEPLEDLDGLLDGGFGHHDGLETAFQGGVLLDVLAVLVDGGGADHAEVAPGEGGFEDVPGVHGALPAAARADHGVEFVDEEHDALVGRGDLVDHLFQPFLELAAVLGPGDESGEVEGDHPAVLQRPRDLIGDDALGEPFDDGRLADARVADEHGVVLGPPGQDLHGLLDLLGPADHGVEPARAGLLGEVAAVLVERGGRAAAARAGVALPRSGVAAGAAGGQGAREAGRGVVRQGGEDVLGADVGGPERLGAGVCREQGPFGGRGQGGFTGAGAGGQGPADPVGEGVGVDARLFQHLPSGRDPGGGPQQMGGVEVGTVLGGPGTRRRQQLLGGVAEQPADGDPLDGRRGGRRAHPEEAVEQVGERVTGPEGRSRHRGHPSGGRHRTAGHRPPWSRCPYRHSLFSGGGGCATGVGRPCRYAPGPAPVPAPVPAPASASASASASAQRFHWSSRASVRSGPPGWPPDPSRVCSVQITLPRGV